MRENKYQESDQKEKVVQIRRICKVVKGGKKLGFRAVVVVGDGKGLVGVGVGKANEVSSAIRKSVEDAKKHQIKVPMIGKTIPHETEGRSGASQSNPEAGAERNWRYRGRSGQDGTRAGGHSRRRSEIHRSFELDQLRESDHRRIKIAENA